MSKHTIPFHNGRKLNWPTALILVLFHIGAVAALFMFSWKAFWVSVALHWVAVGFGISLGYHRLHTHQSYQCPLWMQYALAVCGTLTLEGGPIFWVGTHRIHHAKSDQPGDPHSPREGVFWAHMGWILFGETNHNNTKLMSKYAPELARHRFYLWLNNYHWIPLAVVAAIVTAWGGLPLFLWAICLRVTVGLHCTWLINSLTHVWGTQRFDAGDDSRNSFILALMTFGEGWHNNHHALPTSARHGLAWWELDITWITMKFLRAIGLIKHVRVASLDTLELEKKAA
ncbi:MAG: fatty acid desaturase [Bryobacteraceae bacterium]